MDSTTFYNNAFGYATAASQMIVVVELLGIVILGLIFLFFLIKFFAEVKQE